MALGAAPADMLPEIVGEGLRLAGIGVVIGVAAAFAPTRLMSSALFGVSPNDPATFAGVAALLMGAAGLLRRSDMARNTRGPSACSPPRMILTKPDVTDAEIIEALPRRNSFGRRNAQNGRSERAEATQSSC
jgi:hypothetical protein